MRNIKIITIITLFLASFLLIPQFSEAAKTVLPYPPGHSQGGGHSGHGYYGHGGHGYYGHGYYGHGYYGRGYYGWPYWGGYYSWPYWGWGYPYFGLGYYYGYPSYGYAPGYAYGYGYGYPYGEVRTEIKPQNAQVFVDGGYIGTADDYDGWWQRLPLEVGRHRLVFRAPGFQPYVADLSIGPGSDIHLKYDMQPGNDSIAEQDMMLPRSEYRRDYGRQYNQPPYNRPNDRRDDQYRRQPPPMNEPNDRDEDSYYGDQQRENRNDRPLILNIEPSDATVYVDGNYYGMANENGRNELQILLPPGSHRIEVVRPGFETFSQEVMVSQDQDNHINIVLQKK